MGNPLCSASLEVGSSIQTGVQGRDGFSRNHEPCGYDLHIVAVSFKVLELPQLQ